MRYLPLGFLMRAYAVALCCASWIVPDEEREEWLKEWKAELWHVVHQNAAPPMQRITAAFVGGAFRDAYTLSADLGRAGERRSYAFGSSPVRCLLFLLLLGLSSVSVAFLLPGTRAALLAPPYQDVRTLVLVSRDNSSHSFFPSVALGEFRYWQRAAQGVFSDLAFYQIIQKQVHAGHGATVKLSIVRASDNLLDVMQTSAFSTTAPVQTEKSTLRLILSDAAWRKDFHADPQIIGRVVFVMGKKVTVASIASPDAWRLPGKADAWLLEDSTGIDALSADSMGYVVARMQSSLTKDASQNRWHMTVPNKNGGVDGFACISIQQYAREPFVSFAFAALLALLALPATTSLPLGEYPFNPRQQPLSLRLRRWVFFAAKLTLILFLVCFASLDVAQMFAPAQTADLQCVQMIVAFAATLAALRWTLRDQRRRCPVCLQLLRHPVRVGQPSRNFLAWNGTELICVVGHGFLHVPELPTSWFSTQRWLYLDASWKSIFRPPEIVRTT